jgi:hypothetical protein
MRADLRARKSVFQRFAGETKSLAKSTKSFA